MREAKERTREPRRLLLLSGGGAFGAMQVGMLRPFMAAGFRPDVVVGVSAGALNGTFLANNWSVEGLSALSDIWLSVDRRDIFPSKRTAQLLHIVAGHDRLHPHDGLRGLIERVTPIPDVAMSEIPVHVGATNLISGEVAWFSRGNTADVLLASCSLPGLFPPVKIDGTPYIDGGVVSNVPWSFASSLEPTQIVCLDAGATADSRAPDTALGVLLRSFTHARTALQSMERSLVPPHVEVWHIKSPTRNGDQGDFAHASDLLLEGETLAIEGLLDKPYTGVPDVRMEAECVVPESFADRVFRRKSKEKRNANGS